MMIYACSTVVAELQECREVANELVRGKVVSVECCKLQAVLKESGIVTAEKSLEEAGCPKKKGAEKNPKMEGWQIAISLSLVMILMGVIVLIIRAVLRLHQ